MINWKLRLQNKATLIALLGAIFLMSQQFGLEIRIIDSRFRPKTKSY